MNSRHRSREIALQILYQLDLTLPAPAPVLSGQELIHKLQAHYEHFQVAPDLREFIGQLVVGTLHHMTALDELLQKHASNWRVSRMSSLDRSLLRMAVYEMTQLKAVARAIVIDEAIELAKQFGTAETPAFINGVLDSIPASP